MRVRERGLAHARDVLDQQMAARQQAGDAQPNLRVLAEDDAVDLGEHRGDARSAADSAAGVVMGPQRVDARDLRGQLIDFGAQFREALLILGDDLRRRVLGEIAVRELGLAVCRTRLPARRWRLARRSSSAGRIDQARHRHQYLELAQQRDGRNRRRFARREHARRLDMPARRTR